MKKIHKTTESNKYKNKEKISRTTNPIKKQSASNNFSSLKNIFNRIFKNDLLSFEEKKKLNNFYEEFQKSQIENSVKKDYKYLYTSLHRFLNLQSESNPYQIFNSTKNLISKNIYTIKNYIKIIKNLEKEIEDLKTNYKSEKKKLLFT